MLQIRLFYFGHISTELLLMSSSSTTTITKYLQTIHHTTPHHTTPHQKRLAIFNFNFTSSRSALQTHQKKKNQQTKTKSCCWDRSGWSLNDTRDLGFLSWQSQVLSKPKGGSWALHTSKNEGKHLKTSNCAFVLSWLVTRLCDLEWTSCSLLSSFRLTSSVFFESQPSFLVDSFLVRRMIEGKHLLLFSCSLMIRKYSAVLHPLI